MSVAKVARVIVVVIRKFCTEGKKYILGGFAIVGMAMVANRLLGSDTRW